jgi:hypothetical protein
MLTVRTCAESSELLSGIIEKVESKSMKAWMLEDTSCGKVISHRKKQWRFSVKNDAVHGCMQFELDESMLEQTTMANAFSSLVLTLLYHFAADILDVQISFDQFDWVDVA